MTTPFFPYYGDSLEATIRRLTRRRDEIERILARQEEHMDRIDWSAMTQSDRDWLRDFYGAELALEAWHIDDILMEITPWSCDDS